MTTSMEVFFKELKVKLQKQNPLAELLSLKQTGTIVEYHDQFVFLLANVELFEGYAISLFLNGLKNEIQPSVRLFNPKTLYQAFALAKLQETILQTLARKAPLLPTPSNLPKPIHQQPITIPKQPSLLPNHQESTTQKATPIIHQESTTIFQEISSSPTPIQISSTSNTFKKYNSLNFSTGNRGITNINDEGAMFEEPKCLPSHRYYTLGTTMKKKVPTVNVRHYRHSYLQQDELSKKDKELLATELIPHGRVYCSRITFFFFFQP